MSAAPSEKKRRLPNVAHGPGGVLQGKPSRSKSRVASKVGSVVSFVPVLRCASRGSQGVASPLNSARSSHWGSAQRGNVLPKLQGESDHQHPKGLLACLRSEPVDLAEVERFLKRAPGTVHVKEETFGWPPLMFAANKGHVSLLKRILDVRADHSTVCKSGSTALQFAARGGHLAVVQYLLAAKARVNEQNDTGWSALIWAASAGHEDTIMALLGAAAHAGLVDKQGRCACMWAARNGHVTCVQRLAAAGLDLTLRDYSGLTVVDHARNYQELQLAILAFEQTNQRLLEAAKCDDIVTATEALEDGALVNSTDADGSSALLWAVLSGSKKIARLLLQHGARPSFKGPKSMSDLLGNGLGQAELPQEVLHTALGTRQRLVEAAAEGKWWAVHQALEDGAYVDALDETTSRTPLIWAAVHGPAEAVAWLAQARASLESRDPLGWTAMHYAVHLGQLETVSTLCYLGADLNARTNDGQTMQHIAGAVNGGPVLQLLSAAHCDLAALNPDNLTPLQVATVRSCSCAVGTLLALRADAKIKDHNGRSLFALAAAHGHGSVLRLLVAPLGPPARVEYAPRAIEGAFGPQWGLPEPELCPGEQLSPAAVPAAEAESNGGLMAADPWVGTKQSGADPQPKARASAPDLLANAWTLAAEPRTTARRTIAESRVQDHSQSQHTSSTLTASSKSCSSSLWAMAAATKLRRGGITRRRKSDRQFNSDKWDSLLEAAQSMQDSMPKKAPVPCSTPTALSERDRDGRTALALAVQCNGQSVQTLLLELKASPDAADKEGNSVLMLGAMRGDTVAVKDLLEAGANTEAMNKAGYRAMELASTAMVRQLLQAASERAAVAGRLLQSRSIQAEGAAEPSLLPSSENLRPSTSLPALATSSGLYNQKPDAGRLDSTNRRRLRFEGLQRNSMACDVLEARIRTAFPKNRGMTLFDVNVAIDPITEKCRGHAHVDLAVSESYRCELLDLEEVKMLLGTKVRVVEERIL